MTETALGTTAICQVALVVKDVEKTAAAYAEVLGLPMPEIRVTGPEDETGIRYMGAPTEGRARLAFFDTGSVRLELIEPVSGPSVWLRHLKSHGEGVHHIAFRVPDMDRALAHASDKGLPAIQTGAFPGGCYAYLDSEPKLKVMLELLASKDA